MSNKNGQYKHPLEKLLSVWHDTWCLLDAMYQVYTLAMAQDMRVNNAGRKCPIGLQFAPMDHYRELTTNLKQVSPIKGPEWPMIPINFLGRDPNWAVIDSLDTTAMCMYGWFAKSKRMFSMSEDLQILMGATSLGDMTWADIEFPFDCFAIELAEPLDYQNRRYNLLIVRKSGEGNRLSVNISVIDSKLAQYKPLTSGQIQEIDRGLARGDYQRVMDIVNRRYGDMIDLLPINLHGNNAGISPIDRDIDVSKIDIAYTADVPKDKRKTTLEQDGLFWSKVLRTVGGLCMYLSTLKKDSHHLRQKQSHWKPGQPRPLIPDETTLFVTTTHSWSKEELKILKDRRNEIGDDVTTAPKGSKGIHYRRGYHRRPRGTAHDPNQKKTVRIAPVIVRFDLWTPGTIIPGARSRV